MNLNQLNLFQKLTQVNQYLNQKLITKPNYQTLINQLEQILVDWQQTPIKITIIGHCEILTEQIKNLKEHTFKPSCNCEFQIVTLPNNLEKVLRNCDILCLVNDGAKPVSKSEQKLIHKAATAKTISYCLIIKDNNASQTESRLETLELNNKESLPIDSYLLPRSFLDIILSLTPQELSLKVSLLEAENLLIFRQYHQFLDTILETCLINLEQQFQESCFKTIQGYFELNKAQQWLQIQEQKQVFLSNQHTDQFSQKLNQLSNKLNQTIQNTFKTIKQNLTHAKAELINPFMYDTLMYRVQSAIQTSSIIQYKEEEQTYLSLVIKHSDYHQSIHSYIIELCEQELNLWLEKQWKIIDGIKGEGFINELVATLNQELKFVTPLCSKATISKIENKFTFEISNYITLSILKENNQLPFDYHYSQSSWFRFTLVFSIVGVMFLFTYRLFGFIILFIQLINLFTGRDAKTLKLKQQTKELKRIIDNKSQFLVKFIVDRFLQNFSQYLEQQSQQYQEKVSYILQQAESELELVKQKIAQHKEQINSLKEDQSQVIQILQD